MGDALARVQSQSFDAARSRFEQACEALQRVAEENGITADLRCGDGDENGDSGDSDGSGDSGDGDSGDTGDGGSDATVSFAEGDFAGEVPSDWGVALLREDEAIAADDPLFSRLPAQVRRGYNQALAAGGIEGTLVVYLDFNRTFATNINILGCGLDVPQVEPTGDAYVEFYAENGIEAEVVGSVVFKDRMWPLIRIDFAPGNDTYQVPLESGSCRTVATLSTRPGDDAPISPFLAFITALEIDDSIAAPEPTRPATAPTPTPRTEPTIEPTVPSATNTTTPVANASEPGMSRDTAVPIGIAQRIGDWLVKVNSIQPDATEDVLAENQFNDPPPEDNQFFIANVSFMYVGEDGPGQIGLDLTYRALGAAGLPYADFRERCGVTPDRLDNFVDLEAEESITGNLCWAVLETDVAGLVLFVEQWEFDNPQRHWFKLSEE